MANKSTNLTQQLYHYLLDMSPNEPAVMQKLREKTEKMPLAVMQIAYDQAHFFQFIIQLMGVKNVLELGTFTGYSSLAMALALPDDGKVATCDINDEWTGIAKEYWREAGVIDKISLHLAPAIETLNGFLSEGRQESFDFAFIDADKSGYVEYYEKCLQLIRPGGLIAIDNVFMLGKVVDDQENSLGIRTIRQLNEKIKQDDRVTYCIIAIGDGVTLVNKK